MEKRTVDSRATIFIAAGLCAAVVFIVYIPALTNGFVRWDDHVYVYQNPHLRSIGLSYLKWAFTSVVNANYHPLTMISYALDFFLWGLDPKGYHLTNVLFHCFNTFLVFLLVRRLAGVVAGRQGDRWAKAVGLVTAILFGLHPMHVESVAWVSERKDVLYAFFFLLSVLFYLGYAAGRARKINYMAVMLFFILALLSKPMAITLPLVLLIIDFYPLERSSSGPGLMRGVILEKVPFFFLSFISAAVTFWAQKTGGAVASLEVASFYERIDVATRGYIFYLYKMVLPLHLAPFYVRPLPGQFFNQIFAVSLLAFLTLTIICVVTVKRKKIFTALWLYYIVTLFPVIGLVQVSDQAAADRYFYLPSIGPFLLVGALSACLLRRPSRSLRAAVLIGLVAVAAILSFMTRSQIAVWRDTVSLWTREIEVFPVLPAYIKRANAYLEKGEFNRAAADYTVAVNNARKDLDALYFKRGLSYLKAGAFSLAIKDFNTALRLRPGVAAAYNNRGNAYRGAGDLKRSIADYRKAIELSPEDPAVYFNLGVAYYEAGSRKEAIVYLNKASAMGLKAAREYLKGLD